MGYSAEVVSAPLSACDKSRRMVLTPYETNLLRSAKADVAARRGDSDLWYSELEMVKKKAMLEKTVSPRRRAPSPQPAAAIEIADVSKWGGAIDHIDRRVRNEALQLLIELAILTRNVEGRKKGRLGTRQLTPLLKGINLTIERGSVVGVIDVGGVSASALLRILSNCDVPSRGLVRFFGKLAAFQNLSAARSTYNTCRDNMEFDARLMGWARNDVRAALGRIPEFYEGATKHLETPIRRLSRQVITELGLSLLCCLDYDILVVDEIAYPRSASVAANWEEYLRQAPERGKTVILSSRQIRRLYVPCTHLLLIKEAELLDYGPAQLMADQHAEFLALAEATPRTEATRVIEEDDEDGEGGYGP
jgi:ABC-type polysaccharide/polyol phosphate transport system ATPase subunit